MKALLLGASLLAASALQVPPVFAAGQAHASPTAAAAQKTAQPKVAKKAPGGKAAKKGAQPLKPGPLADLHGVSASPDVVQVANWVSYTHNAGKMPFILIDKKNAHVYLFDPNGKLKDHSPALLGEAVGDDNAPGIGTKPFSKIGKDEKITPAGRFRASRGPDTHGDQVIWIDYNAAVSMHRMHQVSASEHRAERLASPETSDNRISYGCVNVPPPFFDRVLWPTVTKSGAIIYVLPETRTPQQQFGAFDVAQRLQLAQASSRQ